MYAEIAPFYDRWVKGTTYDQWAGFIHARMCGPGRILDLCCGTGTMITLLSALGHEVTGVDGSAEMLEVAATRTPPGTELLHARLPATGLVPPGTFDAVICTSDSANYLVEDGEFAAFAKMAADALRPGGMLIFDVLSRHAMRDVLGDTGRGGDLDGVAYVWRSSFDSSRCEYRMSFFVPEGELYRRVDEHHVQRLLPPEEIRETLAALGFSGVTVTDDYTDQPAGEKTIRESWVAVTEK